MLVTQYSCGDVIYTLAANLTLHPKKALLASSRISSPWNSNLLEYQVKKNFPCLLRYVPFVLKNSVDSGLSLYVPALSGNSHSGCPEAVAASLNSALRYLS